MKPGKLFLIIFLVFFVLIVILRSCQEDEYIEDNNEQGIIQPLDSIQDNQSDYSEDIIEIPNQNPETVIPSEDIIENWPDSIYSSVKGYPFLSDIQKEVIIEVNKCRSNPSRYADEVLEPFLKSMNPNGIFVDSNGKKIKTKEGKPAVKEAIEALRSQKPCSLLKPQNYLCKGAIDHCKDQGPDSYVGHGGTDGSSPTDRARRYNPKCKGVGENIQYGSSSGKEIVRDLIIDDGVASRGHRENFYEDYVHIGVGFGTHAGYDYMCVIDFE